MSFTLNEEIIKYIENHVEETKALLKKISIIPAPSNHEEKRAEFVKDWLLSIGADNVYIDSALNVVFPLNCENQDDIVVFMAHTDTVFPDTTYPMPYSEDEENIYSPGVGDDTVCLAILLMTVKYILEKGLKPKCGLLFVANSGEEGLGNLKGVKKIMEEYGERVKEFYTYDGTYDHLINKCVGSHRYKITLETEGGHSFNAFGNTNAIYEMSKLIGSLKMDEVPKDGDSKTTYNFGVIEGGTSVNTIAQKCELMYEYRSDSKACIDKMEKFFYEKINEAKENEKIKLSVTVVGIRPCGSNVDSQKLLDISEKCKSICEKHTGLPCRFDSGSTDANIPQSMGVPAVCVGVYQGGGAHTREEWVEKKSVPVGLKISFELVLDYFN